MIEDRHMLYIVGEPGSGKSTLVEAMTAGVPATAVSAGVLRWRTLQTEPPVVELGARRDGFSGTDALAMNVQPTMVSWLATDGPGQYVLGEGDRLANLKFFRAVLDAGWYVHVACLQASPLTLAQRRSSRAFLLGVKEQSESWVRGRRTKLYNMLGVLPSHIVSYHQHGDGAGFTAEAIHELATTDPVAAILQGGAA